MPNCTSISRREVGVKIQILLKQAYVGFAGLGLVSQSIMMCALLAEHEFNVGGAVLFHLVISLTSDLSVSLVLDLSLTFMMASALIAALVAAVVVIVRR